MLWHLSKSTVDSNPYVLFPLDPPAETSPRVAPSSPKLTSVLVPGHADPLPSAQLASTKRFLTNLIKGPDSQLHPLDSAPSPSPGGAGRSWRAAQVARLDERAQRGGAFLLCNNYDSRPEPGSGLCCKPPSISPPRPYPVSPSPPSSVWPKRVTEAHSLPSQASETKS